MEDKLTQLFFLWCTTTFMIATSSAVVTEYGKLIGSFGNRTLHDVEGSIYAINSSRIWVRGFSYDGLAPDANFFAGSTDVPSGSGVIIPDENGLTSRLSSYTKEDFILHLPEGRSLQEFKWISIWCSFVGVDFGSVAISPDFEPPSEVSIGELGFTPRVHDVHADDVVIRNTRQIFFSSLTYDGFGPAAYFWTGDGVPDRFDRRIQHPLGSSGDLPRYNNEDVLLTFPSDLSVHDVDFIGLWCVAARQNFGHLPITSSMISNIPPYVAPPVEHCQVLLEDNFHISWSVNLETDTISLTFRGIVEEGEYLAFGVSGSNTVTRMVGSDVTVVWMDPDSNLPRAEDYYLSAYSQCTPNDGRGACPDELQENGVNDVILKSGKVRDGVTVISIERPITAVSSTDKTIALNGEVPISWGIGYINPTGHVAKHHTRAIGTVTVNFGNPTTDGCPELVGETVTPEPIDPWDIEPIYASEERPLTAYIGPAGGRRGYQGIAGQVGWGIAWYINDTLIPEIHVERGKTYTFIVFGGDDVNFLGFYHPFYITNSSNGGYAQKTDSEKQDEVIYAGPVSGSLCEYHGTNDPEAFTSFDEYLSSLTLNCDAQSNPGVLNWTVSEDTPDTVYYQCYQHRFFGWKIHVTDRSTEPGPSTVSTLAETATSIATRTTATYAYPSSITSTMDEHKDTNKPVTSTTPTLAETTTVTRTTATYAYPSSITSSMDEDEDTTTKQQKNTTPRTTPSSGVTKYGKLIGSFGDKTLHDVEGSIYAIDKYRIWVRGFSYDGEAPDANFFAGNTDVPSGSGVIIPDENGLTSRLSSYSKEDFILHLPEGRSIQEFKWISIWCSFVGVDFGSIAISPDFEPPSEVSIGELGFTPPVHRVHADDVVIVNTRQIFFSSLTYDGYGPAAFFWTGDGVPDRNDLQLQHPLGSDAILPRYTNEDVLITFPSELSVHDVDFIGLWCVAARQNFGHLLISSTMISNIPPYVAPPVEHCQVLLEDRFHISWSVDLETDTISLTFRGIVEEGEYLAFGVSGSDTVTQMRGSDVTVVWMDPDSNSPRAEDYYLSAYSQCTPNDGRGACPDELQENGVNDVILKSGKVRDGVTVISIERPITAVSSTDKTIALNGEVPISWGIGYINPTGHVAKHHTRAIGTVKVNFGNPTTDECPELVGQNVTPEPIDPWDIEPIYASEERPLTAYIGPAGGMRGYQGIAGQVGWGIAWYINDTLIPEIHVERGKTYTFIVFGGDDVNFLGFYHPFYITNSPNGGYAQKTESEKQDEVIYAGPVSGSLCEYLGDSDPEVFNSFDEYFSGLTLNCDTEPNPGVLLWTVAEDTPDIVYYQCYQHRFFGWKIHVTDRFPEPVTGTTTTSSVTSRMDEDTTTKQQRNTTPQTTLSSGVTKYGKLIGSFGDETLHDVKGSIYAIDKYRIWVRGFSYDGKAPDAKFLASRTDVPSGNGIIIPDENGLTSRLSSYSNDDFILNLPEGISIQDFKWISIWCSVVGADFGSVAIPANFEPPSEVSIGKLGFNPRVHNVHAEDVVILNTRQILFVNLFYDGFGPAAYFWTGDGRPDSSDRKIPHPLGSKDDLPRYDGEDVLLTFPSDLSVHDVDFIGLWCIAARQNFGHLPILSSMISDIPPYVERPLENCQVLLEDKFHISWKVNSEKNTIRFTFRGILEEGEYLAFGVSGSDTFTQMVGSDVTVVWMDPDSNSPRAEDYYLNDYSQCTPNDGRGACPDDLQQNGVNDVELKNGEVRDGVTVISVERPITAVSPTDKTISLTDDVPVSWGIGFINPTGHVAKHHTRTSGTVKVNFGNPTNNECPALIGQTSVTAEPIDPWDIEPIYALEDKEMTAHIGPAGGRRGYQGIVGQIGWGIAWYIDGRLIPEIHVERGKTYTFIVFGGSDSSFLGNYHPFYITNSPNGGYAQKTSTEKQDEVIYAGPVVGTLCEYLGDSDPDDFTSFKEFFSSLTLNCTSEQRQAGILKWTVAKDTPDTVYYQCYQHRFFGGKIQVSGAGILSFNLGLILCLSTLVTFIKF